MEIITTCKWYDFNRVPRCSKNFGMRASIKCHSIRKDCPYYEPSRPDTKKAKDV